MSGARPEDHLCARHILDNIRAMHANRWWLVAPLLAGFFALLLVELLVGVKLRAFRIDLAPGQGLSEVRSGRWQREARRRANYTPEGQRWLRLVWCLYAARMVVVLLIIAAVAWAQW
jgi:ABC-type sugar transport system permease subunit